MSSRIPSDVRVILHIGQMKTGTTALQEALHRHRVDLLKAGILYPKTGTLPRHSDLAWSYWPPVQINGWVKAKYNSKPSQTIVDEIEAEILACGAKSVIVSAEEFSLRPARLYRTLLQRWRDNLHLVVWLRRQDEMIASMYKQNVLNQGIATPFTDYVNEALDSTSKLGQRLNYDDFLSDWESAIDKVNIAVSLYTDETKNELWRYFVSAAQLDCDIDVGLEHSNVSLQTGLIEFVRRTNSYIEKPVRNRLISDIMWLQNSATVESDPLCSAELRGKILTRFDDQNRKVAQRYFGRSELF